MSGARRWTSPRFARRAIWLGIAVVAAAGVAALFVFGPNRSAAPQHFTSVPATVAPKPVKAKFSPKARQVVARFILTAVARKHLEEAWTLVGPNLKGGLSKKEWLTGNNPVVPFPIDDLQLAPYKIDYSYKDSALLEVALLPKKNAGVRAQIFFLEVKKVGKGAKAHWVVDNWVPRGSAVIPR
jgi:hypothetical protein